MYTLPQKPKNRTSVSLIMLISLFLIFIGCTNPRPAIPATEEIRKTKTVETEVLATSTLSSLAPNQAPTDSSVEVQYPTFVFSPSPPPSWVETKFHTQCLEVQELSSGDKIFQGSIIASQNPDFKALPYRLSLKDRSLQPFPKDEDQLIFQPVVSPDGTKIAYRISVLGNRKITDQKLIISSTGLDKIKIIPWQSNWFDTSYWINNEQLILPDFDFTYPAITVLDPLTGKQTFISRKFADIYDLYPVPRWNYQGPVLYDPTLRYAVYPKKNSALIIRDTQESNTVIDLEGFMPIQPAWSLDGKYLAYGGFVPRENHEKNIELFITDLQGHQSQVTDLFAFSPTAAFTNLSWSPAGQYIAFWFHLEGNDLSVTWHLAIYDQTTGNVTNYCISAQDPGTPVWSPNGHQLMVRGQAEKNPDLSGIILVDLDRNYAELVGKELFPIGWIIAP